MSWLRRDLRLALRALRQGRLVGVFAVVSLAAAVAGNAATFSLISTWILKPLPYPEPDRLVVLGERERRDPALIMTTLFSSLPTWADYRDRTRTLEGWAAFLARNMALSLGDRSEAVVVGHVTPVFFRTLGGLAVRGRLLEDGEGVPGGPRVAVVTTEYWQGRMDPERDPVGSVLRLDGEAWEVVGVLEEGFEFIVPRVGIWLPLQDDPGAWGRDQRYAISVARLAAGVTMEQVEAEVAAVARRIEEEYPGTHRGWTADPINLRTEFPEPQTRIYLALVQGAMLSVLLIACANITNLLLARSQERRREIALRSALGAGRLRILGQLVRESALITVIGGAAGLGLAWWGVRFLGTRAGQVTMEAAVPALDLNVVLLTAALTASCALLFGLVPGLQLLGHDVAGTLREAGPGGGGGFRAGWLTRTLVVAQVALCVVAVGGGAMFVRSFLEMRGRNPGYEGERLLTVRLEVPAWKYGEREEVLDLLERIRTDVESLPEVAGATFTSDLPEHILASTDTFRVVGEPVLHGEAVARAVSLRTSPEYLATFAIPLLQGRFFERADGPRAPPVAVVSRTLAERRFPHGSPLGRLLRFRGAEREIVGVAGDVTQTLLARSRGEGEETIYLPMAQLVPIRGYLVAGTTGPPADEVTAIEARISAVDPDIVLIETETMEQFAGRFLVAFDLINWLLGGFVGFALILASLGTYGVVAYTVARRRHEIGVRAALGATPQAVVALFAREGIVLSLAGVALGTLLLVPVVILGRDVVAGLGLSPPEPAFVGGVCALLLAVTTLASVVPSLRATRIDPARVLQAD